MEKTTSKIATGLNEELIKARKSSVSEFGSIEHRLEFVDEINGVEYVNDSKATDVNSTWYSLEYMTRPVVWIVGTSEVETDFSMFSELVRDKVKALICLGDNKSGLLNPILGEVNDYIEVGSVEDAVKTAKIFAKEGDVVLFSPGCSSFHLFMNYKDRGERFRKAVKELVQ